MDKETVELAIVGGGTIGLILAAGLCRHESVTVKVYERASSFRNLGAGIAFTGCALQCMRLIGDDVLTALRESGSVTTSNTEEDPRVYLRWTDGFHQHDDKDRYYQRLLYELDAGQGGFEGCRRDQFLEALVQKIPPNTVEFQRDLHTISSDPDGKIVLTFSNGTSVKADAVIGCDGIRSRVRQVMLGEDNAASYPHFSGKVAHRALIPMEAAVEALGDFKARNTHSHVGPGANIITYPVAHGTMINATVFTSQEIWPESRQLVSSSTRKSLMEYFKDWHPCVRALLATFPETIDKWAIFDLYEYPVPCYTSGRVCLAGDAAHASSPHHGAGAGMGVEDALCLVTLIRQVTERIGPSKLQALAAAWQTYDAVRRTRSQWLVNSSRRVVDLYHQAEWAEPSRWVKAETCFEEVKDRSYKIWNFDVARMVEETVERYTRAVDNFTLSSLILVPRY